MRVKPIAAVLTCYLSLWTVSAAADPVKHAEHAVQASGRASGNASASAGHSLAATGQLASGVIATPILASGIVTVSIGSAAKQVGGSVMDSASRPIGKSLPITDETVSILPPNKALHQPTTPKN